MKQILSILIALGLLFSACNAPKENGNSKQETSKSEENIDINGSEEVEVLQYGMFVASKKLPYQGVGEQMCLMVRSSWETVWTPLFTEIEGFNYEPGYEYHLEVKRTTIENPPADGSAFRYQLIEVLSKEKKESDLRPEHEKPTFEGTWNLTSLNGKDVSDYHAYIFFKDRQLSAYSGCNTTSGIPFEQNDKVINFKENAMAPTTLMACPEGHIEDEYFKTIFVAKTYEATSRVLKFYNQKGKLVLLFER